MLLGGPPCEECCFLATQCSALTVPWSPPLRITGEPQWGSVAPESPSMSEEDFKSIPETHFDV